MAERRMNLALGRLMSRAPEPLKALLRPFKQVTREAAQPKLDAWDRPLIERVPTGLLSWPPSIPIDVLSRPLTAGTDLRCLLVTESLDASGTDEFVAFLARRLPEQRIKTAVLLASDAIAWRDGSLASTLREEGVAVFSGTAANGPAAIANWSPDVVYSHGAAEWPLTAARDLNIPTLEAMHGMHNVFGRTEAQLAARRALLDRIVAVSELVRRQYLARDLKTPPEKVVTIPNGINRARASHLDRRAARAALGLDGEFLFLSLARHVVQKNTYGLAEAFLEVAPRHPSAHMLICGRPDEQDYARQVVNLRNRSAVGGRLHIRDNAHRVDVLLAAADVFVLDSFFEGWSLASMEALGAGVPVLLSDVGGAREQLSGAVSKGMLVDNPLGDPLRVDWRTCYNARFARQVNRAQLTAALSAFATSEVELALREEIREDSLERFSDDACLRAHAQTVYEIASIGA
ncbi:glycosyltransferase family 4 protein [Rhizobium sp. RAF56]|uniref:glycosyltransferase family 4 protein n=1 Tax=Rhizobium sp. RAF56 TaxID=3233062 RepID=UPI003F9A9260